jgi:peptide/nickel transport system substrate-binding protein
MQSRPSVLVTQTASTKLLAACVGALLLVWLANHTGPDHAWAQGAPQTKKGADEKKGEPKKPAADAKKAAEKEKERDLELPPLKEPKDDEWLPMAASGDGFDRVTLLNGKQFDVEMLSQRPTPLKVVDKPLEPNIRVVLLGSTTGEELELPRNQVKEIKYFEDMLLDQGLKDVNRGEMDRAFDLYQAVLNIRPDWAGVNDRLIDYWTREVNFRLRGLDYDRVIDVLHTQRQFCKAKGIGEPTEAKGQMGRAVEGVVEKLVEARRYYRARPYLALLEGDYPDHEVAKKLRGMFEVEATKLARTAKEKEAAGQIRDAAHAIIAAADIWPNLPGIDDEFKRIFTKYPVLFVAVRELPLRFSPWAPAGSGDARVAPLLHLPLMEVSGIGEKTQFSSSLADPELGEGGRRITLRIKPGRRWSDGEKPITAMDVARSISARCDRSNAGYDSALASLVSRVNVPSLHEVQIDLNRTTLRPQTALLFNLAAGHKLRGDQFAANATDLANSVGAGPFRAFGRRGDDEAVMQANQEFFGGPPKISEIIERRYATGKDALNALIAGDVALVEHVPVRQLRRAEARKDDLKLKIARSAVPALHVISFDFRSRREFHSRTLRRAMIYALDRKSILEGFVLEKPAGDGNELAQGPFPRGSYAFQENTPWAYYPVLAKGLIDVALKELRVQAFRFSLHYPDVDEAREACKAIQTYWKLVGIEVDLRPMTPQVLEEEIAAGRRFELVYRTHYVRDPVLDAARVLCLGQPISPEGMAMPNCASGWLRQNLRELELANNWLETSKKLNLVQVQARNDVAIIPLWQLVDYYAYRTDRLSGFTDEGSVAFYQNAARWQVTPWYRKDAQ